MSNIDLPKSLSRHQYGTLKYIDQENPTLSTLRIAHAGTLSSLLHASRGYLIMVPHGTNKDDAIVTLSKAGTQALRSYEQATLNQRSHEMELTERCLRLLQLSRRRSQIGKSA